MNEKKIKVSCVTNGCNEEIGAGSITGLCKRCYSSVYGWTKRSNADIVKRIQNLHLYESRINFLIPKAKVKILRPKAEYTSLAVLPGKVAEYRKRTKYKTVSIRINKKKSANK